MRQALELSVLFSVHFPDRRFQVAGTRINQSGQRGTCEVRRRHKLVCVDEILLGPMRSLIRIHWESRRETNACGAKFSNGRIWGVYFRLPFLPPRITDDVIPGHSATL